MRFGIVILAVSSRQGRNAISYDLEAATLTTLFAQIGQKENPPKHSLAWEGYMMRGCIPSEVSYCRDERGFRYGLRLIYAIFVRESSKICTIFHRECIFCLGGVQMLHYFRGEAPSQGFNPAPSGHPASAGRRINPVNPERFFFTSDQFLTSLACLKNRAGRR